MANTATNAINAARAGHEKDRRAMKLYAECQRMLALMVREDMGANLLGPLGYSVPQGRVSLTRTFISQLGDFPELGKSRRRLPGCPESRYQGGSGIPRLCLGAIRPPPNPTMPDWHGGVSYCPHHHYFLI